MFRVEIADKEILECTNAKAALRMSRERSGRSLYAVAEECGMSESHLSRCLNQNDDINLPHQKTIQFMVSCGNAIYLRWQYLRLKELLPELEHDDGACIASEVAALRLVLREAVGEIKAALPPQRCQECGAQFALGAGKVSIPGWLVNQVWLIEQEFGRVS